MEWEVVADLSGTMYETKLNDFTVYISELDLYDGLSYELSIYKRYRIDSEEIFNSGLVEDDNLKVLFNKCHNKYYDKQNTDGALMELWNTLESIKK